jgi:deazaflavin-dependent oxidoreductase (nitroreductase family)
VETSLEEIARRAGWGSGRSTALAETAGRGPCGPSGMKILILPNGPRRLPRRQLGLEGRAALITTNGAKSGAERTTPLTYTRDGDEVVVIASNYGRENHPAWFHNLKANQDVRVEIGSESYDATATLLPEGSERQRLWDERVRQFPNFKGYQDSTDRLIPVVVIRRR